jgi:two-component system nitrogen regulation response regulator GlnG
MKRLIEYSWPGNVRELQSVIRRALLESTSPVLSEECLSSFVRAAHPASAEGQDDDENQGGLLERLVSSRMEAGSSDLYAEALEAMETFLLARVLRASHGNQSQASRILGITRGSLRNKIHTHRIHIDSIIQVGKPEPESEKPADSDVHAGDQFDQATFHDFPENEAVSASAPASNGSRTYEPSSEAI